MMAFSERSLDDYVDVAQRIADFREQYPHGSLQPADPAHPWEQAIVSGFRKDGTETTQTFIVYTAAAYRTPDDERPGIGVAWEIWPGRTPYTLGSELMNAETSAWGRAIVAVLASDSKAGVASRQEVKARRAEREDDPGPCLDCGHHRGAHFREGCDANLKGGCPCKQYRRPTNADGSLSRSRTSDAEKAAAGVMTAAQQAEHTALGGGHPNEHKTPKAERGRVVHQHPCDCPDCRNNPRGPWMLGRDQPDGDHPDTSPPDPWDGQPAGSLPEPEHQPGSISPQQQRAIHAACTGMERPARLATISDIVGRAVTSSNELSFTEAARVLEKLSGART